MAEDLATLREDFEKFVQRHFRSVESLGFSLSLSCSRVSAPTRFLPKRILPRSWVGMGGKTFRFCVCVCVFFLVGYFLTQT